MPADGKVLKYAQTILKKERKKKGKNLPLRLMLFLRGLFTPGNFLLRCWICDQKGPTFIFRAKKPIQCLSEGLHDGATLACQTPSRCHYSRELKNRRVLALAVSLRDVQGAGLKGSDALTTDQFSALDFESPFSSTSPDPDTTGGQR